MNVQLLIALQVPEAPHGATLGGTLGRLAIAAIAAGVLAARHFRDGAIPTKQCYSCHTGYGIFGTMESKRDGLRHWLLYVTRTWKEPVTYKGSYPNANCLQCHAAMPAFREVPSHAALREPLARDEMGCFTCHGLPHPARPFRTGGRNGAAGDSAAAGAHGEVD